MDPLSDLLRVVRLDGAFFYAVEAAEPWSVETVAAKELSPRIMPGAEHLISYHILTEGRCYGGLIGEEQVELVRGDVIVCPPRRPSRGRGRDPGSTRRGARSGRSGVAQLRCPAHVSVHAGGSRGPA